MSSIKQRLLLWLLLGFSIATVIAAVGVYRQALFEARDLFDYQLEQTAFAFPGEGFGVLAIQPSRALEAGNVLIVQIWDQGGAQVYRSRPGVPMQPGIGLGFATVSTPDGEWRVYSAAVGENIVRVMQPTSVREQLAAGMALRTILPLMALLPVLIGLGWLTVGRGLKPLNAVAAAVSARSAEVLDSLPDRNLPAEVRPLVGALNDLLARLGRSLDRQRAFIADAAHELRTPLTALMLQIEVAERAESAGARAAALERLKEGVARATRLVGQLLTLARNEPEAAEQPLAAVDLVAIAREVVAERAPIADARDVELGLSGVPQLTISGNADGLRAMIGNLVDNAIQHTPAGGAVEVEVEVAVSGKEACVVVSDSGPGIPPADRERVFDRFYRGAQPGRSGSGLGLAIVKNVAQRHGAAVELATATRGGLQITVRFPGAVRTS